MGIKRLTYIRIILFLLSPLFSFSQINYKGKPLFYDDLKLEIPIEVLPEVNVKKLKREDKHSNSRHKNLRFAKMIDVDFNLENNGIWVHKKNERIWYFTVKSPGAYSLSIVFSQYRLPVGSKLFIYSSDKKHVRGAFTYKNNKANNRLPIAPIKGDEIIIEYHEPFNVDFKGELNISAVGHDYKNVFNYLSKSEKGFGDSGECNININCDKGDLWQLLKHSVCKITYNGYLCTGALINNTNNDGFPYLLTANHCINIPFEAENAIFYFNYESPVCINLDGPQDQTISGSTIIATPEVKTVDFSLLELSEPPPPLYKPYYAGWNRDLSNPETATSIHHPSGDVKKITKSFDGAETGDFGEGYDEDKHWWIDVWDEGTTEGGSSGSPLFDQNGRIIGDLTGGDANCLFNFNDYYQKLYHSWEDYSGADSQLRPWLDPNNSGIITLDGYLPYDTIPSNLRLTLNDTVVNLEWNHVMDTANINYYYIYRNSLKLDSVKNTVYSDTTAFKGISYEYYVTAKYLSPVVHESSSSNSVFARMMVPVGLPFYETFESGVVPGGWYEEKPNDTVGWEIRTGGYASIMDTAFEGSFNAYFYSVANEVSKLVLPRFDFSADTNLKLSFYLHMQELDSNVHQLNIIYSEADSLGWTTIRSFDTNIDSWERKEILLPNLSSNYRVAFEGVGLKGYGICIDSVSITEDGKFIVPDIIVNNDTICIYDSLEFSTSVDNSYSLNWEFGPTANPETAIGKGPHWVKYSDIGIKTAKLIVNDTYITEDYNIAVVYESPETPSFTNNGNTLISSSTKGNQWYFNGQPIQGAIESTYLIEEDGNYLVEVTNSFNCIAISEEKYMVVDDVEEIEEEALISGIRIYPNPNNGIFTVQAELLESGIYIYKVYDVAGRIIKEGNLDDEITSHQVDLNNVNEGIYFIQINSPNSYFTEKILIKK